MISWDVNMEFYIPFSLEGLPVLEEEEEQQEL
jgi:hypothetical protein